MFVILVIVAVMAPAQRLEDPLLDHLIGKWVLQGEIAGKETTHAIEATWMLGHQYIQLHELSLQKDTKGQAEYEAIVFIGWDQTSGQYQCLWLDTTGGGGITAQAIGHAKRSGDEIAFLFKGNDNESFHTTFTYNRSADAWRWSLDGESGGKLQPFARVTLTRKTP